MIHQAWLSVDFFFTLSGFVIAFGFGHRLSDVRSAGEFILRRFGRLWPLHIVVLFLFCLGELGKIVVSSAGVASYHPAFTGNFPLRDLPANLVFMQALHGPPTWNGVSWSISAEFWTYLAFCAACLAPTGFRSALYGILAVTGLVAVATFSPVGMMTDTIWGLFRCFYGFFSGVLAFRLWYRMGSTLPASSLLEFAAIVLVLTMFHFAAAPVVPYCAPIVFAGVILVFAREGGWISELLRTRPLQALGLWSYGIYMLHPFVIQNLLTRSATLLQHASGLALVKSVGPASDGIPMTVLRIENLWWGDLVVLAYCLVLIALAALAHRAIEEPGRSLFNLVGRERALGS